MSERVEIPTRDGLPACPPHSAAFGPVEVTLEPGTYSWCTCGLSAKQPFCDGTHKDETKGTNRKSLKFEITQAQTVKLCRCKHTKTPPFCDGTHNTIKPKEKPVLNQFQGFVTLLGRLLIVPLFANAAYNHIVNFAGTTENMAKVMPFAPIVVQVLLAGACAFLVIGSLCVLFGFQARVGALLLALFLLAVTPLFHNFWAVPAAEFQQQLGSFMKNFAVFGGLMFVMAFGPGPYSFDSARAARLK